MSIYNIQTAKQEYLNQFYQTLLSLLGSSGSGAGDIATPRLTLIGETLVKVDELMYQSEGIQFNLANSDNSNVIQLYVNSLMDEAAKHILQIAPRHILIPTQAEPAPVFTAGSAIGFIFLPEDYLRLISFKIAGWLQDAVMPITTLDPLYILQKYRASRGGIAKPVIAISSAIKTNVPVAQVDHVEVVGSSGSAHLSGPGALTRTLTFNTSEIQTATDFVTAWAADYAAKGITLTRSNATLIFTAAAAGTAFDHPTVLTVEGDLTGEITFVQANVPAKQALRTLEYYSDPSKQHTLEKFTYVPLVGAEHVQQNLHDALTWLCASKVLQIWGESGGNGAYAEKAMQQVELSFKNLL
jgi:hypothetical protein